MTITVTPTVDAVNIPPRVQLNVSASAGETSTTVTRQDPDGSVVPVRTQDGGPTTISAGAALIYDYEAPFAASVTFSSLESPATVSAAVTVPASQVWLIHPGVPGLSMAVTLAPGTFMKRTAGVTQSVLSPMGRKNPIVVSDGARKGYQSSISVQAKSMSDIDAVEALVADAGVLLLNVPTTLAYNFGTCYIAPGAMEVAPVIDKVFEQWLVATLPFYVVDRPAGGTTAERTYADLTVYATYADLASAYPTYADVLAGP